MEFGLEKCATLTIHKRKATHTEGITLSNNNTIKGLSLEESYKYLGVHQAEDVTHRQVKKQTSAEYTNRVRKILKSKLNGGNTIQAINNWAVPVIIYTAGIVDWTIAELEDLDRKTRKLMTAHRTLHPQSDIDRLYLPRRIGRRGLLQIRQTVEEKEIRNLSEYISSSTENALKEVITEGLLTIEDTKMEYTRKEMRKSQEIWLNKALHGQYLNDTDGKTDCEIT